MQGHTRCTACRWQICALIALRLCLCRILYACLLAGGILVLALCPQGWPTADWPGADCRSICAVVDTRLSNVGGGAGLHPAGDEVGRRLDRLLLLGGGYLLGRLPGSLLRHLGTCRPRLSLWVLQVHHLPLACT